MQIKCIRPTSSFDMIYKKTGLSSKLVHTTNVQLIYKKTDLHAKLKHTTHVQL